MSGATFPLADEMLRRVAAADAGKHVSLLLTLLVHFALVMFLLYGIQWQTKVSEAVEVELVRASPLLPPSASRASEDPPVPPPVVKSAPPVPEPKSAARVEPPSPPPPRATEAKPDKPDIALRDEQKEKKEKSLPRTSPQPQHPPPRELPALHPQPQADTFQKQLEQELRRTAAERKTAEASSAAARELVDFQSAQAAQAKSRAMIDYVGKIRARIRSNIILPPDIKGNPEAIFEVVQFPSGEILSVHLKKSSGHAAYDAAVERAIHKSSPLPKPESGALFSRTLELRFHPLDD
ncbi:MAG: TonB C-terminal domain-containing protein [Sterolibacterium sp.]|nr:TonB C-terminal domain-containing protein [Sterolibacterium sp.]MBP9799680.1 TonB C-terminal domain-containing protein [Sterolibacterium sp.]